MTTQELTPKEKQELQDREQTRPGRTFVPDVDIREDEQALWLWADMPGVDPGLRSRSSCTTTCCASRAASRPKDYDGLVADLHRVQRRQLPASLHARQRASSFDRDQISARLVNGVLEVKLPKAEKAKPRRIDVAVA